MQHVAQQIAQQIAPCKGTLSEEYSVSICVLITTSQTIYISIKMRSMAETYGHLLPLVRTTCLRRPVVSATICFVSVLKNTVIYFRWCAQHVCTHRFNQLPFVSLQRYTGCEATVRFLRIFDHVFDLLNYRNPLGKGSKAPMSCNNRERWETTIREAEAYIVA